MPKQRNDDQIAMYCMDRAIQSFFGDPVKRKLSLTRLLTDGLLLISRSRLFREARTERELSHTATQKIASIKPRINTKSLPGTINWSKGIVRSLTFASLSILSQI